MLNDFLLTLSEQLLTSSLTCYRGGENIVFNRLPLIEPPIVVRYGYKKVFALVLISLETKRVHATLNKFLPGSLLDLHLEVIEIKSHLGKPLGSSMHSARQPIEAIIE